MALHTNDVIALEILCNTLKERLEASDSINIEEAKQVIDRFHDLIMDAETDNSLCEDLMLAIKVAREITEKVSEVDGLKVESWAVYKESEGKWVTHEVKPQDIKQDAQSSTSK